MATRSWTDCAYAFSIEVEDAQSLPQFESWLQDSDLCYGVHTITDDDEENPQQLIEFQVEPEDLGRVIIAMQMRWPLLACVFGEVDEPESLETQAVHYIDLFTIHDTTALQ